LQFVAGGLDDFQLEAQAGKRGAALRGDHVGLRERERAAARGDDDGSFSRPFFSHRLAQISQMKRKQMTSRFSYRVSLCFIFAIRPVASVVENVSGQAAPSLFRR
jgi:hypothetical protein